ncbi:autotransporter outer membrane beta-barrel domain-containing protein [Anaerovibrio sp. RM50]|uniref:autotransporter outer membrane beta-barrel domain-containing protein n=1 Tax=Anaerovibrio sp. RM50 TaxID=1200557 RepID=UPI0004889B08|nr:autotransporter outer membrane beta-barrel domain-containing protein [Anaerovibrio sp. RM50]
METRKYKSPLGGDISNRKVAKGNGWKGLKGQAALALAVSLWIAVGGVEAADITIGTGGDVASCDYVYNGHTSGTANNDAGEQSNHSTTITAGGTVNYSAYGGSSNNSNAISNSVTMTGGKVSGHVYGGYSGSGEASYNNVSISGSAEVGLVYGGMGKGTVRGNQVTISGEAKLGEEDGIYGGYVSGYVNNSGLAQDNILTLARENLKVKGIGAGYVRKSDGTTSGNVLILQATGIEATNEVGANIIKIGSQVVFNPACTVIKANDFTIGVMNDSTMGTLDISEATGLNTDTFGSMTLLQSGTRDDFKVLKLTYDTATQTNPVELNEEHKSQIIRALMGQTSEANGVRLAYDALQTVSIDADKTQTYKKVTYDITGKVNTITLGEMNWNDGRSATTGYDYSAVTSSDIDGTSLSFKNPENIGVNASSILLAANNTLSDGLSLTGLTSNYSCVPVTGVTLAGQITGNIASSGGNLVYTNTANNASQLTFTDVEWKDSGALLNHATTLSNVSFNGAAVDTSNINFTNIKELEANKTMTLVSDFGNSVGEITGTKYKVGSTLEGTGKASLSGNDLIFTAETGTSQEQTHNTVMGAEVGMAALSAGNDFVGAATEGLAMAGNTGTDGMATYANMGGGSMNVETGSHVKTHTWNAILALGHKNEKKLSTTEYGAFFEYGTGNYSTFNGDERGDGSTRYTGGGILGKWQKNNGFYVEGSLRAGSIHDDANNVLRDVNGNPYSYTTDATYWGAHIGVGREIKLNKTDVLDLYAKYFYNHRGSVSFDAGGHYDLDAVESSVLRVGTRYTVKQNDNINYYGGLAVEHEFCGRASGFADGVAIRGADISGTSVRGEIGATFRPGEKSNVTLDLNLSGFAGKKQGLTGGLSAVFHI